MAARGPVKIVRASDFCLRRRPFHAFLEIEVELVDAVPVEIRELHARATAQLQRLRAISLPPINAATAAAGVNSKAGAVAGVAPAADPVAQLQSLSAGAGANSNGRAAAATQWSSPRDFEAEAEKENSSEFQGSRARLASSSSQLSRIAHVRGARSCLDLRELTSTGTSNRRAEKDGCGPPRPDRLAHRRGSTGSMADSADAPPSASDIIGKVLASTTPARAMPPRTRTFTKIKRAP
eukprot:tig00000545_g2008.t1